jgi:hypothetical protein
LVLIFFTDVLSIAAGLIICRLDLKYLFNIRINKNKKALKRSDLKIYFCKNADDEEKQERNTQLMENAQELPRKKSSMLVPRKEIVGIELTQQCRM